MSEDAATSVAESTDTSVDSPEAVTTEAAVSTTSQADQSTSEQAAREAAWFAKNPTEGEEQTTESSEAKANDTDATNAPPVVETPKVDGYEGITAPQAEALKRFKVSPSTWGKLDVGERTEMLASAEGHIRYTSQLAQENATLKRQMPANQANSAEQTEGQANPNQAATAQQNPPPAKADGDHWKAIVGEYGDEYANTFKGVFQGELSPLTQQMTMQATLLQEIGERHIQDDIDAAFNDLTLPDGIDKDDPAVRKAITDAAWAQFGPDLNGFSIKGRSLRQAIPAAAATLYQQQAKQAAQAAKTDRVKGNLRGSANRTASSNVTTRAPLTQEDRDKAALEGLNQGKRGEELARFVAAGGKL